METARQPWKPTMTRAEADAWARGSAYPATVYHATTASAATVIRRLGFDLGRLRFGRVWGHGIYATPDRAIAARYAALIVSGAETLALRVNVRRVLSTNIDPQGLADAREQVLRLIPEGFRRYVEIGRALLLAGTAEDVRSAAFTRVLQEAGYDMLDLTEPVLSPIVGGTQVVIFDARRVVVIHNGDPD